MSLTTHKKYACAYVKMTDFTKMLVMLLIQAWKIPAFRTLWEVFSNSEKTSCFPSDSEANCQTTHV